VNNAEIKRPSSERALDISRDTIHVGQRGSWVANLMGTLRTVSNRAKALGIVLIVIVGLFNFHVPHFLIEPATSVGDKSYLLELVFLTNLLGGLAAAAGIYRNGRWGWFLGMVIAGTSFTLYLAQETVGLPGLPKVWLEPSRIVSLVVEVLFVLVAWYQVVRSRERTPVWNR
jgi:hypothetical protein